MKNRPIALLWCLMVLLSLICFNGSGQIIKHAVPDHTVVLTFDDAVASHYHIVAPVLKKYGFGATFFVCEFPPNFSDSTKYMTWNQMRQLHDMGFEIGNHTWKHIRLSRLTPVEFKRQVQYIENKCKAFGIPKPVSFAYPVWKSAPYAIKALKKMGYSFARSGGNRPYDPLKDHPYLIPSYNEAAMDSSEVFSAFRQAKDGKIVVMTIHGVPDYEHSWVSTSPALFKIYMKYLYTHHYQVISMRELGKYINSGAAIRKITPSFGAKGK